MIGPNGQAVPAQVTDNKDTTCSVAFTPRVVGEHRISVSHRNVPVIGSPFSCKVYDVTAIKVKDSKHGVIGMPVTFLGIVAIVNNILKSIIYYIYRKLFVDLLLSLFS